MLINENCIKKNMEEQYRPQLKKILMKFQAILNKIKILYSLIQKKT